MLLQGIALSCHKAVLVASWLLRAAHAHVALLDSSVFCCLLLLPLLRRAERLVTGSNTLCVWDINTTQLLYTLDPPAGASGSPNLSSSSSSASLAASAAAANTAAAAAAAAAVAADADLDEDEDLLQNGWLLQDDDSDSDLSEDEEGPGVLNAGLQQQSAAAAAVAGPGGSGASMAPAVAPWTSISCNENLVAAGKAHKDRRTHAVCCWFICHRVFLRRADAAETAADTQTPDFVT